MRNENCKACKQGENSSTIKANVVILEIRPLRVMLAMDADLDAGNDLQTRIGKGYDCSLMMLDSHASHERSELWILLFVNGSLTVIEKQVLEKQIRILIFITDYIYILIIII